VDLCDRLSTWDVELRGLSADETLMVDYPDADDQFWSGKDFDGRPHYFDKEGNPLTLLEWGKLFEDLEYKRVGRTYIGKWLVSTVWLGLDHRFGPGPPLFLETMVFDPWGDDQMQDRYSTEADALDGHELACAWVRVKSRSVKWQFVALWKWMTRTLVRRLRFMKLQSLTKRLQTKSEPTTASSLIKSMKKVMPYIRVRLRTKDTHDSK